MEVIQAKVNPALLHKADRLFTGTLEGRVIELLQNARRAGARHVQIVHTEGRITVQDDGPGIEDFSRLLDLGGSGWDDRLEASEDPAGVGLFCLAPRELVIRSNGRRLVLDRQGWQGRPVSLEEDPDPVSGTLLQFSDEPWDWNAVARHAVFSGLQVTINGRTCPRETFLGRHAEHVPSLGCRVEVRRCSALRPWHHACYREHWAGANVLVNFHGQVVPFGYRPVRDPDLHFLVELTGEPTGIRLMLPARTRLVENEAFEQLKATLEQAAYRYCQRKGRHRLPYKEYRRALELGIELPEAEPTMKVGLLVGEEPPPVEVTRPAGISLAQCCRPDGDLKEQTNLHLLAALGEFSEPLVPVLIHADDDGYSWSDLPRITRVDLTVGNILHQDTLWGGRLVCVDDLTLTATANDGRTWRSAVCMAVRPVARENTQAWWDDDVLVTPAAREHLDSGQILYHLGGYSDEGDTWETQGDQFRDELDRFWDTLLGPHETRRRRLFEVLSGLTDWTSITLTPDGRMVIHLADQSSKIVEPPQLIHRLLQT